MIMTMFGRWSPPAVGVGVAGSVVAVAPPVGSVVAARGAEVPAPDGSAVVAGLAAVVAGLAAADAPGSLGRVVLAGDEWWLTTAADTGAVVLAQPAVSVAADASPAEIARILIC
jgi:hypothetical protein